MLPNFRMICATANSSLLAEIIRRPRGRTVSEMVHEGDPVNLVKDGLPPAGLGACTGGPK